MNSILRYSFLDCFHGPCKYNLDNIL